VFDRGSLMLSCCYCVPEFSVGGWGVNGRSDWLGKVPESLSLDRTHSVRGVVDASSVSVEGSVGLPWGCLGAESSLSRPGVDLSRSPDGCLFEVRPVAI